MRLKVARETWTPADHVGPLREAGPPPLVILRNRVKLRQVEGEERRTVASSPQSDLWGWCGHADASKRYRSLTLAMDQISFMNPTLRSTRLGPSQRDPGRVTMETQSMRSR